VTIRLLLALAFVSALALRRSEKHRLGDRCRERLRIRSCCLTRTDSATTERAPPGPKSRATVTMTWTKRTTRLLIQYLYQNG